MLEECRTGRPPTGRRPATASRVVRFHAAHELTLMAHSPRHYTEMGRLMADAGKRDWDEFAAKFGARLMQSLAVMSYKRSGRGQVWQGAPPRGGESQPRSQPIPHRLHGEEPSAALD